jgi:ABC-2 type transport system permease protein
LTTAATSGGGGPARRLRTSGGPLVTAGKVLAIFRLTLQSQLSYVGEFLVRCVFLLVILFAFTELWKATSQSQGVLQMTGYTLVQLIWYLAFTEAMITSTRNLTSLEVDEEVRSGNLAYRLARPLSYPLHHLGAELGERILRFALNLAVGCLVALLLVGPIPFAATALPAALSAALLAFLIDFAISFTISLFSFWIEDTTGLHLLYRRLLMLAGGMLIPLEAYPDWLERIARALPFQYLVYQPARLFVGQDPAMVWPVLLTQAWMLALSLIPLIGVYKLGLRRVSLQGG